MQRQTTCFPYDEEGTDTAFVCTFANRHLPTSSEPERDFDTTGFGIVKILEHGRTGTTHPRLPWEPKAAFHAPRDRLSAE
jgi:hypothetical protein